MGYVAVQGGITAIENSQKLNRYLRLRGSSAPLTVTQIIEQMGPLVDRVMSEGGLYSPFHAALAVKQASGDPIEASFLLRAYRSTLRRLVDSLPVRTDRMRIQRRISSAFKTIPGGQVLGSTSDYEQRILDFSLASETEEARYEAVRDLEHAMEQEDVPGAESMDPERFRKVVDLLRDQGLVPPAPPVNAGEPTDITQESAELPMDRSGRLQMLARAETGGVLALAYSSMRGYGQIHPTIGELRVGHVRVRIPHPFRPGQAVTLGSVVVTEVEIVASAERREEEEKPGFTLGYGACFGHNEVKAISMAVLDRSMKTDEPHAPAEDQEFVLLHTDGIESSGFCSHFKLPHYVTFQADLDRLRTLQAVAAMGSDE
ncbi:MAG TPA: carbon-phosphorus lyase complex subunit PhnI [Spirochaetia bacterium]|nr:carbon-phosphorus lyase complex subunit PhnI [Spirochaetia bacterium]